MRELVIDLRADGHEISHIDLGGGLGIPYNSEGDLPPHPEEYAKTIIGAIGDLDATLIFEPGRLIAGNAGILVTTVLYDKKGKSRDFLIVDAAMNDLLRPTLYDAHHEIMPLTEASLEREKKQMDIVGPVCETGDFLAENRMLPAFQPGERLAVMSAGAYGAVLSSTYNSRLLVPEVMVLDDKFAIIRPKSSYEDLISLDQLPEWLKS